MKANWFQAQVQSIKKISPTKMSFSMKIEGESFDFQPGQFITMDLPLGEKRRQRWRSYSIANISNRENILEFGIGHIEDGAASEYFFSLMKIGDHIKFKGPDGAFLLPKNLDRPIVMIATGTGVVPFVSMIRKIRQDDLSFKNIHLIYGCRHKKDILYRDELETFSNTHPNFILDIVLSQENDWSGHRGHVHEVYQSNYTEKEDQTLYLLCGWSAMIDEAMANLFPKVVSPPSQIKYELYG
jgi:CDP-4-dehydro-6-deoxyglucose reductase